MPMHKGRRIAALLLAGVMACMSVTATQAVTYRDVAPALHGNPILSETRDIARGITHSTWKAPNANGRTAVFHALTIDTSNPEARAVVWHNNPVSARSTLTGMIQSARAQGYDVVAGVNGDFFNLGSGAPIGLVIRNGELVSSDGLYSFAVGFRPDGTTVMGNPDLEHVLYRNGMPVGSFQLNKEEADSGPYAYTPVFGSRAASNQDGVDVVVQTAGTRLTIGGAIEGTVVSVNTGTYGTPIGANQVILSAREGKPGYPALATMVPGDVVRLEVRNPDGQWAGVTEGVGALYRLLENGSPVQGLSASNVNPATLVGRKPDGKIVLVEVDGRQPEWSNGVSYAEAASLMLSLGCADAVVCDGGGSSTVAVRLPGDADAVRLNRPSDGSERKVSNALLFVSTTAPAALSDPATGRMPAGTAAMLHVYPGTRYALPNAVISWQAKATDAGYHAADVPAGLSWASAGGFFTPDGQLTVTGAPGLHAVTAAVGAISGQATFIVPDSVSAIRPSRESVVLSNGESVDLSATAWLEGVQVAAADTSFSWWADPAVGSITPDGVFTATGMPGTTGAVTVSYGAASAQVPVMLARSPAELETFDAQPLWQAVGIRAKGAAVRSIADPVAAPFGDGLLRLFYDFAPRGAEDAGTAGVIAGPAGPEAADGTRTIQPVPLDGTPTAIGVWVHGDGSRYWLRGQITDAAGRVADIDYTPEFKAATGTGGIDWTGWKYVEAAIPAGLSAPFTLSAPIRLMCPQEDRKKSGTLLFDRFRAIYGAKGDDVQAPVIDAVWPAEGTVMDVGAFEISTLSHDPEGGSGINPDKVSLTLDGVPMTNLVVTDDPQGLRVSCQVGAQVPAAGGAHVAVLRMEDRFGNKTSRAWTFHVNTATPQLSLVVPATVSSGETFDAVVQVKTPNPLKALSVEFRWDPALLEPVDLNGGAAGVQMGLEKFVAAARVTENAADKDQGVWRFAVTGLNSTVKAAERRMLTLRFRSKITARGAAGVSAIGGTVQVSGVKAAQTISLPLATFLVEPAYVLDVRGVAATGTARLSVTDRSGTPVSGATVFLNGAAVAKTDAEGRAQTSAVGKLAAGAKTALQAVKGGLSSASVPVVVGAAAGTGKTRAVTVSPISQPGGMTVHWLSTASSGTFVQVVESAAYAGSFPADAAKAKAAVTATTLTDPETGKKLYEHKAVFYDLKSGTAYKWQITDGPGGKGATGGFTTPVSEEGKSFAFGFLTDPQAVDAAGYVPMRTALERMLGAAPDLSFVILGGDVVDNGAKTAQWWGFHATVGMYLQSLPFLAIPGNHEYKDDAKLAGHKAFWGLPATGPSGMGETCYTVKNGDARFYMLDTQASLDKQIVWLRSERAAEDAKWNIVVMHRGIYGSFYDEKEFRAKLAPVFDELGIDLVLSGHDHNWVRTTMKGGKKVQPGAGTTYITGGSAGGKFYDDVKRSWTEVFYGGKKQSLTLVRVSADRLEISASHVDGAKTVQHDAFVITK